MRLRTIILLMVMTFVVSSASTVFYLRHTQKDSTITTNYKSENKDDGYVPPKFTANRVIASESDLEYAIGRELAEFNPRFRFKINTNLLDESSIERVFSNLMSRGTTSWHVSGYRWYYPDQKLYTQLTIEIRYVMSLEEDLDVEKFVDTWIAQNIHQQMSDEEKVRKIHDHIVSTYYYQLGDDSGMIDDTSAHAPASLIKNKCGVCQGYAALFQKMLTEVGIENRFIVGSVGKSGSENHIWNLVKLDNAWYHVDTTWDDPSPDVPGRVMHRYYLRGDYYMSKTHQWVSDFYPKAKKDYETKR
ncbi:MAG: transglutaminase domain-containing protein [Peptostreptococcaceae bacterium]|nr:transglutaminase domain-containing protein [Peptostreptococcaceae bacterium]